MLAVPLAGPATPAPAHAEPGHGPVLAARAAGAARAPGPVPAVGPARAPGQDCAEGEEIDAAAPWPRGMLAYEAVWPFTRGNGVTVAVLSTGVDASQPQLRGRVRDGFDAVAGSGNADRDCTGTGTQVAGIVAAQPSVTSGVVGLAPRASILPVRVVADDPFSTEEARPGPLARGLTWAAGRGADVIVVAAPVRADDRKVREAVADAVTRGITVVAAAGDLGGPDGGNPASYPAAYPDVLGVGALGPDARAWPDSQRGQHVDLVAPGVAVPTVQRGEGLVQADGTAVAAGHVAAAAALVRSKRGDLVGRDIAAALVATASPAPRGPAYGAGVVNPYAAVTDQRVAPSARPLPAVAAAPLPDDADQRRRRNLALAGAGLAALAVVSVLVATAAARRGRRQRWRPGLATDAPSPDEPLEPGPPVMLLDDPADAAGRRA